MQTANTRPSDGLFEELFPSGCLASAFVDLPDLDVNSSEHPNLTDKERRLMSGLRVEKRRRDWLGGRLAAKRAVIRLSRQRGVEWHPIHDRDVEVLPGDTREPIVYSSETGQPVPVRVSISHSGRLAGAIAWYGNGRRMGFDLEEIHPVDPALYRLAFHDSEIKALETARPPLGPIACLVLWTAKEAVSKALGTGLSVCLQDIEVSFPDSSLSQDSGWEPVRARFRNTGRRFTVYGRRTSDYVLSLASAAKPEDR